MNMVFLSACQATQADGIDSWESIPEFKYTFSGISLETISLYNRPNQAFRKAYFSIRVGVADSGCLSRNLIFFRRVSRTADPTTKKREGENQFYYIYLALFIKLKIIKKI